MSLVEERKKIASLSNSNRRVYINPRFLSPRIVLQIGLMGMCFVFIFAAGPWVCYFIYTMRLLTDLSATFLRLAIISRRNTQIIINNSAPNSNSPIVCSVQLALNLSANTNAMARRVARTRKIRSKISSRQTCYPEARRVQPFATLL